MHRKDLLLTEEEHAILAMVAVHPGLKHLSNSEIGHRLVLSGGRHRHCVEVELSFARLRAQPQ